jgi:hypothetical protein
MLRSQIHSKSFVLVCASAVLAGVIAAAPACRSDTTSPPPAAELDGTPVSVGNGTAYTYVINRASGAPSLGVAVSPSALDGLPSSDTSWTLALPPAGSVAPFDHVTLDWNAHGHPPAPYMQPHFDVHFYMITSAAQAAIQGGADTVTVPPAYVPPDYVSGVESVPDMGVHWIDTTGAELHGQPFDRTFIYGYSRGSLAFFEPMVTRAFLASKPTVSAAIKQPASFARSGRYPTRFRVYTDAATNTVRVELDSLVAR